MYKAKGTQKSIVLFRESDEQKTGNNACTGRWEF